MADQHVRREDQNSAAILAGLDEQQRERAFRRFEVLRPHLEHGVTLAAAAARGRVPARTARRWLARLSRRRACRFGGRPAC